MSKKSKRSESPEEEIVAEETVETVENPAEEAAEENTAVSEEPENIGTAEEAKAEDTGSEAKVGTISRPVNFRTGPTFRNAVIAELKAGAKVTITGSAAGDKGTWYKCGFDGREGFVKASGVIVEK